MKTLYCTSFFIWPDGYGTLIVHLFGFVKGNSRCKCSFKAKRMQFFYITGGAEFETANGKTIQVFPVSEKAYAKKRMGKTAHLPEK